MKTLILSLLLFNNIKCSNTTVYLCDSTTAYRYHLRGNCRGLSNCRHSIIKTDLESAQKAGRTLCGWEK